MATEKGKLFMIPVPIGDGVAKEVLGQRAIETIKSLDYFIVENIRTARRFLAGLKCGIVINDLTLAELNEHTRCEELPALLEPLLAGRSGGMLSEAGVPGVADPGADLAALCHRSDIDVVPLTGPCSIILALMASGLNGQSFAFNGYLPVKAEERRKAIRHFERRASAEGQTQIFIETPYRNRRLYEDLLAVCNPTTKLCIAADITTQGEFIRTMQIGSWKRQPIPPIDKKPAVFIIL